MQGSRIRGLEFRLKSNAAVELLRGIVTCFVHSIPSHEPARHAALSDRFISPDGADVVSLQMVALPWRYFYSYVLPSLAWHIISARRRELEDGLLGV